MTPFQDFAVVASVVACLAAILTITPMPGAADLRQMQIAPQEQGGPCEADINQHCSAVEGRHNRTRSCLQEHVAELQPQCRSALQPVMPVPK
jgi:hypothetical protein